MFPTNVKSIQKRQKLLLALCLLRRRRQKRKMYIRELFENRTKNGEYFLLSDLENDPLYHLRYFRMNKESFDTIFGMVGDHLRHSQTHAFPIPPKLRLAITLRYLATGSSQVQLALSYRISPSSVGKIIRETLFAICKIMQPLFLPVPTPDTWIESEKVFKEKWNFPFCIGAIDGKHIRVKCPYRSGSTYFNYKGFFSKVLMAVVGPDYRFLVADIGAAGSDSDGAIFPRTSFFQKVEKETMLIPKNGKLGRANIEVPHVFVGDEAFPLKPWLMRPFPGKDLDLQRRVFNYRLSRARRVVENAFGILAARWRIFFTALDGDDDLIHLIIQSAVILHNFLRSVGDCQVSGDDDAAERHCYWRNEQANNNGFLSVPQVGSNNYGIEAFTVREVFKEYFSSDEGRMEGQEAYVMRS